MLPKRAVLFLKASFLVKLIRLIGSQDKKMTAPAGLSDEVVAHLTSEVMIIVSVRAGSDRATIARSTGALYCGDKGWVSLFVSAPQWPETVEYAGVGGLIAATFTRPDNYISYQIKGRIVDIGPATEAETTQAASYVENTLATMARLGVTRVQLSHTFAQGQLVRISFLPRELFIQTPGPQAGLKLYEPAQ
jgi:hypothetical protein